MATPSPASRTVMSDSNRLIAQDERGRLGLVNTSGAAIGPRSSGALVHRRRVPGGVGAAVVAVIQAQRLAVEHIDLADRALGGRVADGELAALKGGALQLVGGL